MPVDVGEIARKRRGEYERQIVDRGAVSQLPDAVLSGEVGDDESCRKRDDHTGSDAEDAADEDQRRDVADEQAGDAAQQEDHESDDQNPQFVAADPDADENLLYDVIRVFVADDELRIID